MFKKPLTIVSSSIDSFFRMRQVQLLESKHPRLVGFVHARLGMQNFFGLPFTTLLLVLSVNLSILSELSEHIVNSPGMQQLDSAVSLFFFNLRENHLNASIFYFSQLGSEFGVAAMFACSAIALLLKGKWPYAVSLLVSVLGTGISTYFTKLYFHRERPLDIGYYELNTFSFPSGHAAGAVALVGMLCVFVVIHRDNIKNASWWILTGILYILLIGLSRIYLGVHFLSDVAGGYLLGSLWVLAALTILEYLLMRKAHLSPANSNSPKTQ